ncbi:MAG: hypothetical protein KJ052_13620 [Candidatus Hydrogenedentes bacterium]|nr:hypothetical protein [Candidatus Hydrogenedentota bacterium]
MVFVTGSANIFGWLPIAMLFVIIFVVCFWLLPMLKLQGVSRLVAALCVAALCILGMMTSGTPPEAAQESEPHAVTMTFVLIPYTALGLSLVLMALLLLVMRWLPDDIKKRASIMPEHGRQRNKDLEHWRKRKK